MAEIDTEKRSRYLTELTLRLRHNGFTTGPISDDCKLNILWQGKPLCIANGIGGISYDSKDVRGTKAERACEKAANISVSTKEYMNLIEAAPKLQANGLDGDYRLLSEHNRVVFAGRLTQYGAEFVTWERTYNGSGVTIGHYYDNNGYDTAKRDFAVRSGLVKEQSLFSDRQLAEIYRCVGETLESGYPITEERKKLLEGVSEQIERAVPDLDKLVYESNEQEMDAEGQDLHCQEMGGM